MHAIRVPVFEPPELITMIAFDQISHIPIDRLLPTINQSASSRSLECAHGFEKNDQSNKLFENLESVKRIVDRVQKHVCGSAEYSDMCVLLQRNNIWYLSLNNTCQV